MRALVRTLVCAEEGLDASARALPPAANVRKLRRESMIFLSGAGQRFAAAAAGRRA